MLIADYGRLRIAVKIAVDWCVLRYIWGVRLTGVSYLPVIAGRRFESWLNTSPELDVLQQIDRLVNSTSWRTTVLSKAWRSI